MITRLVSALVLLSSLLAASADAQSVRYRRPFFGGRSVSAYFDHSGGGCTDWACGGVCYDGHTGTDYPMPVGTAVAAAASGTVVATFNGCANYGYRGNPCGGRCGNHVVVQHGDGSRSTYCHMELGSIRVSVGSSVGCGTVLGSSASSGSSTGPHLHFGHRTGGAGSSSDPYAGSCSRASTLWVDQGSYRGNPSEACSDVCSPTGESCNGRDDDCDGRTDEDLRRGCGTDVGECVSGVQTCSGGGWGHCAGEVPPRAEECDGRDQDCDGGFDEALVRSCGTDVGECVAGTETCSGAAWQACVGAIDPVPERCDLLDNDCDGANDDEQICEREEVAYGSSMYGGSPASDASGDGGADACALTSGGFTCVVGNGRGFVRTFGGAEPDAGDFFTASAIRMGDLDGDGRADVCGRQGDRLVCWRSSGEAFGEVVLGPAMASLTHFALLDVDGDGRLDACLRDASGLTCHRGQGGGFGAPIILPALSDEAGFSNVIHHGSIRFADVDADGRMDVCARDADGLSCWRSEGSHFGGRILGPRWSDAEGYGALSRWSTLRMADVDGDGHADACIRALDGFGCALGDGRGFGEVARGPVMSGEVWERLDVYSTIRMADLDGDGRDDLCAREPDGARCWISTGRALDRLVVGPELTDAEGWSAPARFRSIRLGDVSGDGHADLCAVAAEGLRCWIFGGGGFTRTWLAPALSDGTLGGYTTSGTLRIAGGSAASAIGGGLFGELGCSATPGRSGGGSVVLVLAVLAILAHRRRA